MLILSEAKITIRARGLVRVEGTLRPYQIRIAQFIGELGLSRGVIRLRAGHYIFSRHFSERVQQRLRNFLVNECPLKGR